MTRSAILTLRLGRFRSYDAAAIETGGTSVALHGPNGAGKTNILEAVSMLSPGRGLRRAGADELAHRGGPGWRIRAEVETPGGEVEIVTGVEDLQDTRRTVAIDGKPAPQTRLAELFGMIWLTPAMDRLWIEGATERRQFLDRLTMGFTPSHAEAASGYEKAMRARNRLLREPPWDAAWLDGIEAQMARHGARIARARADALTRLIAAQDRAQTLFPRAELSILGAMETRFHQALATAGDTDTLEAEEAAELARRLAAGRTRDAAAGRTLDGPHRSDLEAVYASKAMPARACSTGEQKALLISLVLGHARAIAETTGAAPILLLDEVAAHLDEGRRRALYAEIRALGAQVWMTGTGPELFDGLEGARQFAVSETDGISRLAAA
ncbi:DNA replication/repair protein RecF [Limibaculum sp. M0105]|uniref:DNA replication and repair protein RecF n=1 Tax=Thermohalobaculum xanthum TaxID=2753746 RepID=A0A8J7M9P4_9RHOB|nr:DNA replication/repair protein RecF [Thermohalobaculum xanthum]MBK0400014.1 DNA replication/repair protein RecF [Thermohalobaculum xanthum]